MALFTNFQNATNKSCSRSRNMQKKLPENVLGKKAFPKHKLSIARNDDKTLYGGGYLNSATFRKP